MLVLATVLALITALRATPSQVHISITGRDGEMMVSWSTPKKTSTSCVQYGVSSTNLDQETCASTVTHLHNSATDQWVHNVLLEKLASDTTYYYQCGDSGDHWSGIFFFHTQYYNITYAVYGDFGLVNDQSLNQLIYERTIGSFQQVLHVGDFAYDFQDHNGSVGDEFLSSIQPVAAYVPYMPAAGNHEAYQNFSEYVGRFSGLAEGAGKASGSGSALWYSWDAELVHFVVFDTEMYFYSYDPQEVANALSWLEKDLQVANKNRQVRPWLVALGHKAAWMDKTDYSAFGALFQKYGVDLVLVGHQHNYNRMMPYDITDPNNGESMKGHVYKNPKYPVQIVTGAPGNQEHLGTGAGPTKWTAVWIQQYGYGHLRFYNATHVYWDWIQTASTADEIATVCATPKDYLWLIKEDDRPHRPRWEEESGPVTDLKHVTLDRAGPAATSLDQA